MAGRAYEDPLPVVAEFRRAMMRIFRRPKNLGHRDDGLAGVVHGAPIVMMSLASKEGEPLSLSPTQLAEIAHVSNARMANILRALEKKNLIERIPSSDDRRRVSVRLTDEGLSEHKLRMERLHEYESLFVRGMGEDDVQELTRLLNKAADVIERIKNERGEEH